jgi:uncharacterized membrane protein YkvA (DUF1232 family)
MPRWRMRSWSDRIRRWAARLRREITALWIAVRSPETPLAAKLVGAFVVGYALSPIDLIPDFIPVIGYLDDLLLVPLGLALVVRLIPESLMKRFRYEARSTDFPAKSLLGAALVMVIWLGALYWLAHWMQLEIF